MTNSTSTLGNFSLSLAVKDLQASMHFYQQLGFTRFAGDGKRMAILQNGATTIGLFQGMFERNLLTFNPGWDSQGRTLPEFTDVRQLLAQAQAAGLPVSGVNCSGERGPGSFVVTDPDGNPVLIDQHV
ncbi:MAG: VOC family protein [Myxococcota bacterium]